MKIQSTGLKAQNQEETPVFENPGWIRANSVSMKAHLCFKALRIQGLLDPICLGSKVRIREGIRIYIGFRLDGLDRQTYPLSLPSLGFHSHGHLSLLLRLGAIFSV